MRWQGTDIFTDVDVNNEFIPGLSLNHTMYGVNWNIYGVDVVEWSRALDVRLSEWCCSVTMVWVQIPSREEQKKILTALKSNSNTVWFNFQTYIYIYIYYNVKVALSILLNLRKENLKSDGKKFHK